MAEKKIENKEGTQNSGQESIVLPETKKISMWIESYDDIFSDFDPRPYSEKVISDDFIIESKKMFKEKKSGRFELRLLAPQALRDEKDESIIKKRLKNFFKSREKEESERLQREIRIGILLIILGSFLMFFAAFISESMSGIFSNFLIVAFEPAGWFSVWYGLDQLFYRAKEEKKELVFIKKISDAEIIFEGYQVKSS